MKTLNFRKSLAYLLSFGSFGLHTACQTTGGVTRIDKEKHRFELQSQDDSKSSMMTNDDKTTRVLMEKLSKRIKDNPRDLTALVNMAQAQLAIGQYDQAEASCRDALRVDLKNETSRKILAQIYYRRGNLEMAKVILNGIDAIHSKDSQVLNLLGMIALRQNQPEFALQSFTEALKNNPSDVAVRMNLGVLYVHYRQLGLAAVEFERILKVMPDHPDAKLHLAIIESNRGNLDKAEDLNKSVLKSSANNPVAIYNLAVLEDRRKNFDKALDYLKRYIDTDFAKQKNNQEVFALIDKIRNEKEALTGEKVTDADIMRLAAKKDPSKSGSAGDKEFVEADARHAVPAQGKAAAATAAPSPAAPAKAPTVAKQEKPAVEVAAKKEPEKKKKSYRNDEEEIEDLEKQLE